MHFDIGSLKGNKNIDGSLEFTTGVSVVPDIFPYEDCTGDDCLGTLV